MKRLSIILSVLMVGLCVGGCSSIYDRLDKAIPDGEARKLRATVTGKFSSTTIEADGFRKTETEVTAERMYERHNNAWVPLVELEIEGYKRVRKTPQQK
jgi:hypothetical protein